jgi:hypothetical protein
MGVQRSEEHLAFRPSRRLNLCRRVSAQLTEFLDDLESGRLGSFDAAHKEELIIEIRVTRPDVHMSK